MTTNWIFRSMVAVMAIGAIGCGQGFKPTGSDNATASGVSQPTPVDVSVQIAQAQKAVKDAQAAMAEADAAVASITDSHGNINVNLFSRTGTSSVQTNGLLSPLLAKLQPTFDKVFAKFQLVTDQFTNARGLVASALAKLNPADAAQAAAIVQLKAQLANIDQLEGKFHLGVRLLAGKMTLVITGLDNIVNKVTAFIPGFGWLAQMALDMFVMQDVKDFLMSVQQKLMTF